MPKTGGLWKEMSWDKDGVEMFVMGFHSLGFLDFENYNLRRV